MVIFFRRSTQGRQLQKPVYVAIAHCVCGLPLCRSFLPTQSESFEQPSPQV
jgi:hypothetical protein